MCQALHWHALFAFLSARQSAFVQQEPIFPSGHVVARIAALVTKLSDCAVVLHHINPTEALFELYLAFQVTGERSRVAINLGEATPNIATSSKHSRSLLDFHLRGVSRLLRQLRWKPSTKRVR